MIIIFNAHGLNVRMYMTPDETHHGTRLIPSILIVYFLINSKALANNDGIFCLVKSEIAPNCFDDLFCFCLSFCFGCIITDIYKSSNPEQKEMLIKGGLAVVAFGMLLKYLKDLMPCGR